MPPAEYQVNISVRWVHAWAHPAAAGVVLPEPIGVPVPVGDFVPACGLVAAERAWADILSWEQPGAGVRAVARNMARRA